MSQDDGTRLEPAHWHWEVLPEGFWAPDFDSPCDHFHFERREDLSLYAIGTSYKPNVRQRPRRSRGVPGQINRGDNLDFSQVVYGKVSCEQCYCLGDSQERAIGHPTKLVEEWSCEQIHIKGDEKPSHCIEWILNIWFFNLLLPESTRNTNTSRYTRSRSGIDWKTPEDGPSTQGSSRDHVTINLTVDGEDLSLNLGEAPEGISQWRPGFIEYIDAVPNNGVRLRIRKALSFALGAEIFCLSTSYFDKLGCLTKSTHKTLWLSRVEAAVKSGCDPLTRFENADHPDVFDQKKLEFVTQKILDSDSALNIENLSSFYFQARRSSFDIRPVLYGSSFEYIRDHTNIKTPTTLLDKSYYKKTLRNKLEEFLRKEVEDSKLTDGSSVEDLVKKLDYFHSTSLAAQARSLLLSFNLSFGEVEMCALSERNNVAHGRTYDEHQFETLIRHVRAFQTLNNRLILAITGASSTYVDYSSDGFPERPLQDALGGPNGDGVPASYPPEDEE